MHGGGDRDAPFVRASSKTAAAARTAGTCGGGGEGMIPSGWRPSSRNRTSTASARGWAAAIVSISRAIVVREMGKASFPADDFVVDGDDRDIFGRHAWTGQAHAQVRRRRLQ